MLLVTRMNLAALANLRCPSRPFFDLLTIHSDRNLLCVPQRPRGSRRAPRGVAGALGEGLQLVEVAGALGGVNTCNKTKVVFGVPLLSTHSEILKLTRRW